LENRSAVISRSTRIVTAGRSNLIAFIRARRSARGDRLRYREFQSPSSPDAAITLLPTLPNGNAGTLTNAMTELIDTMPQRNWSAMRSPRVWEKTAAPSRKGRVGQSYRPRRRSGTVPDGDDGTNVSS